MLVAPCNTDTKLLPSCPLAQVSSCVSLSYCISSISPTSVQIISPTSVQDSIFAACFAYTGRPRCSFFFCFCTLLFMCLCFHHCAGVASLQPLCTIQPLHWCCFA
ncbi:hypothetical protein KC19_12G099200 [Ceratodon purpureus]|uniref:Uncharacterized protein n=1 Tax=Ceratodon purpureus TaxID=3225 RepID=A0A8T0G5J5_CERPU|nr:hypothetical protein KC19_12G099200 [Ceratodon purpureus]